MDTLAIRVDRIISRILTTLPPGNLTFERAYTTSLIVYTLRMQEIKVGFIEIETLPAPSLATLIRFSVIQNNFSVIQDDEELTLEITNLNEVILDAFDLEFGERRWTEITSDQHPEFQIGKPRSRKAVLFEQRVLIDSAHFKDRKLKPWEIIPDHLWDRAAVKVWCSGFSNREIAKWVKVHPRTVTNRICELRRRYPQAGIPTGEQRKTHDKG